MATCQDFWEFLLRFETSPRTHSGQNRTEINMPMAALLKQGVVSERQISTYIHAELYMHGPYTYIHAYIHTYIHTYINYITSITLHYITFTLQYITLHYITLHYIILHYIALHYITLYCITLHYITLHYITLHYITLHICIDICIYTRLLLINVRTYMRTCVQTYLCIYGVYMCISMYVYMYMYALEFFNRYGLSRFGSVYTSFAAHRSGSLNASSLPGRPNRPSLGVLFRREENRSGASLLPTLLPDLGSRV